MKITRRFTKAGTDVYESVRWERRSSRITSSDGSVVFEMKDAEIPAGWSQLATDIVVSKYFRKAGVPQLDEKGKPRLDEKGRPVTGPERSVRQVIHRLVACWTQWGQEHGYFDGRKDAEAFSDELAYTLLHQMAAPNSPQWFNTGLNTAYGITGPAQGHWIADPKTGRAALAGDAYSHPQPHACFIQPVRDDLVNEGGIMDLWTREARLFKYGSGTGTNFSQLRGADEPLSGGGRSSGLMSFLRIGDRAAAAIKSGGTTRRAAKMVCLDVDHPDIVEFVRWKVREELKVAAMVEGMKHLPAEQRELARRMALTLDYDFNGEAYQTVSGQNSNNSVRLDDAFLEAVERDGTWTLRRRTDGAPTATLRAREIWDEICFAAWRCADPGVQYDTTINDWHTCPASGRINASNPCSEYMFLDNTACNLASLNLLRFYDASTRRFDLDGYEHAIRLWTVVLEISVLMAAFPSREVAELSWNFRTLGLGYANLGALLMQAGVPYDSEEGRALCGALTAILTGRAYATSAELAKELGPFAGYKANRDPMLRVIRNHRRAARGVARDSDAWEGLRTPPVPIDHGIFVADPPRIRVSEPGAILDRAVAAWDDALRLGEKHGFRNAQVTVIAPTGTIGLLMDCDTTGVEPDFALTKFKKLAGGGHFKIVNQSLPPALRALGYAENEIDDIHRHVMGTLSLDVPLPAARPGEAAPARSTFAEFLRGKGYTGEQLVALENELPRLFELRFAFSAWSMPDAVLRGLALDPERARSDAAFAARFNGLLALGLTRHQAESLNRTICGTQTIEGAPHLKPEHLPVFDCANTCGPLGTRFIAPLGHIRMMAAAQPFISGAISKTINLPNDAPVEAISEAYIESWKLALKANALYRDGCKLSQPLNTKADALDDAEEESAEEEAARGEVLVEIEAMAAAISTSTTSSGSTPAPSAAATEDGTKARESAAERARPEQDAQERVERERVDRLVIDRLVEARVRERLAEIENRPLRRRLPETRRSVTHRFNVAGHEGYLTVGLYDDGEPGELFITMAKEGSTIGGLMDCIGTATSVSLQYGVPLQSLVNKFAYQRFEPMGVTTNRDIPLASSLVDYIFRWLGMQFIPGYRAEHAPRRETPAQPEPDGFGGADEAGHVRRGAWTQPRVTEDISWNDSPALPQGQPAPRLDLAEETMDVDSTDRGPTDPIGRWSSEEGGPQPRGGMDGETTATNGKDRDAAAPGASRARAVVRAPGAPSEARAATAVRTESRSLETHTTERRVLRDAVTGERTVALHDETIIVERSSVGAAHRSIEAAHKRFQTDAPPCRNCGHITVRNGVCYKCLNCGTELGCGQ
ncbi:MAG TPA: adenosylcobalamin-dependent ribonucleoside-diphosphate reductase [Phycisphaerales bacterium]|nr:adenosylcobalamin-dependent ribonucleoside-diphosphate reductase [Phycisphaerales bacterium]HMP36873.1 adenosylcobalamin-dependent ribonucleoside-diphosphate reductase [Phycisphaerales bacterium]